MDERIRGRELIGKIVVSEERGRKFGIVGDVTFVTESGELINIILEQPSKYVSELNLPTDERGRILIPFSAVRSVGDFVIVAESDIV